MKTGLIIDGGLPRTEAERVSKLLDEAKVLIDEHYKKSSWDTFNCELYKKYHQLENEYRHQYKNEDYEFWGEIEDEVIELINDLLPADYICELHEGDVTISHADS